MSHHEQKSANTQHIIIRNNRKNVQIRWLSGQESACNAGDADLIPRLGRSPGGGGYGNPLQYSCLGNAMDRGPWWVTAQRLQRVGHDWAWKIIKLSMSKMVKRRRQWHPTPVLLPGISHRRRSLVGCSPWGR